MACHEGDLGVPSAPLSCLAIATITSEAPAHEVIKKNTGIQTVGLWPTWGFRIPAREERSRSLYVSNRDYLVHHGPHAPKSTMSVMPTFTRVLITLCIGAAAILAWQSYGDAARGIIASTSSQLGWLAPRTTPIAYRAPDQERFNAISLDLDAIRQIADRIAVAQEQIARDFDQLRDSQEQMAHEIRKLQAAGQQNRGTNSEALLGAAPPSARKPVPRLAQTRALGGGSDHVKDNPKALARFRSPKAGP